MRRGLSNPVQRYEKKLIYANYQEKERSEVVIREIGLSSYRYIERRREGREEGRGGMKGQKLRQQRCRTQDRERQEKGETPPDLP